MSQKQIPMLEQLNRALTLQLTNIMESDDEALDEEIKRSRAVTDISKQMLSSLQLKLNATKFAFKEMQLDVDMDESLIDVKPNAIKGIGINHG